MTIENELNVAEPGGRPCELPTSMSVREARQALSEAGLTAAIVIDKGRPIGIVTADALCRGEQLAPDTTVDEVMDYEAVHVNPTGSVEETMRAFRTAAWHSLWRHRPFPHRVDN
jgi:predicted transcriptional regulator